jgi:hypothetical protein
VFRSTFRSLTLLLVAGGVTAGLAASPAIGVATAKGSFRVDNATVTGNATLFEGTLVETGRAGSMLQLADGVRMRLGSASRGQVYRKRLLLEKGEGQFENAGQFRVEAEKLQILPGSADAKAHVALKGDDRVQVAALAGNLRVTNADGLLLASLEAGTALEFEPQAAGAAPPFTVTGCLQKQEGRYLLKADTAGVTFELTGSALEGSLGQRVEVTGTGAPGAQPGTTVIRVVRVKRIAGNCVSAPSRKDQPADSGRAAGQGSSSGLSGTAKAVIAGVAIAAAGAGTTMALIDEEPKATISR